MDFARRADVMALRVDAQDGVIRDIERTLSEITASVALDLRASKGMALSRFGSRAFGGLYALDSSDLDVVCSLNFHGPVRNPESWLREMLPVLERDHRCKVISGKDCIDAKTSIELEMFGNKVGYTACLGSAAEAHLQSQVSALVHGALQMLPLTGRRLVRLIVDWAKRAGVAWDRDGKIGQRLKGVHWALMVIAWWKETSPEGCALETCLYGFVSFFAAFPYTDFQVAATELKPFLEITKRPAQYLFHLHCPRRRYRNLAIRLTLQSLADICGKLRGAMCALEFRPEDFFLPRPGEKPPALPGARLTVTCLSSATPCSTSASLWRGRVLRDYDPGDLGSAYLSLQQSSVLWIFLGLASGWGCGLYRGRVGWFPPTFVQEVSDLVP
jgi:hypothetical protein